jgi:hypothetical protein
LESLIGAVVVEVGIRQTWLFVTLLDREGLGPEIRLYIDTEFQATMPDDLGSGYGGDDVGSAIQALAGILNMTVASAEAGSAGLVVGFDEGAVLRVSNGASPWTTHEVWWLGTVGPTTS